MKAELSQVGWSRKKKELNWERNGKGAEDVCLFFVVGGSLPPAHGGFVSTDEPTLPISRRNITL